DGIRDFHVTGVQTCALPIYHGVRPLRILKAVIDNLMSGDLLGGQGGSTITQQVIKNSVLVQEKSIPRKVKEWILAIRLEQVLSKIGRASCRERVEIWAVGVA